MVKISTSASSFYPAAGPKRFSTWLFICLCFAGLLAVLPARYAQAQQIGSPREDVQNTPVNTAVDYTWYNNTAGYQYWAIVQGQGTINSSNANGANVTWTSTGTCTIGYRTSSGDYTLSVNVVSCRPVGTPTNYLSAGSYDICPGTAVFTTNTTTGCYRNSYAYNSSDNTSNPTAQPSPDVYYRFTLSRPSQVTISTCGSDFDTYLHVVSVATNQVLGNDDDSGNHPAAKLKCNDGRTTSSYLSSVPISDNASPPNKLDNGLPTILPAGDYFIIAEGYSTNTGNLRLALTVTPQFTPTITFTSNPQLWPGNVLEIIRGSSATLNVTGDVVGNFTWATAAGVSVGSGSSITVSPTTTTTYVVTGTGCNNTLVGKAQVTVQVALVNRNYVATNTVLLPGKNTADDVISMVNANATTGEAERLQQIVYLDGLGRPMQQLAVQGSQSQQDVVVPVVYDPLGRTATTYLPYAGSSAGAGSNGIYQTDALTRQTAFYQPNSTLTRVAKDNNPFSTTVYETSPLNRVLEQGAPGTVWQPGTGHTMRMTYRANTNGEVRQWNYDYTSDQCSAAGTYAAGTLSVKETRDEQDGLVTEYVNYEGKTVLKQVAAATSGTVTTYLLTTYVYDDRNNLRLVISPEGYNNLPASFSWSDAASYNAFTQNWCFRYRYDGRGRIAEKQTPGTKRAVQIIYNQLDQAVLMQDADQYGRSEWTFMKYDALKRPVMTGFVVINNASPADLQNALNNETVLFETSIPNGSGIGYSLNNAYPRGLTEDNLLTINYYDRYNYGYQQDNRLASSLATQTAWVRGLLTGGCVRQVGPTGAATGTNWLISKNYYDAEYRLVQTLSLNHLSGVDNLTTTYDFAGRARNTLLTHANFRNVNYTVANRFTYDNSNRLVSTFQTMGTQLEIILARNHYNEIGQLVDKKLHSTDWATAGARLTFLQKVDYRYNIRGWLTNINDRDLTNGASVEGQVTDPDGSSVESDLFGMDIHYNENLQLGGTAQFNGNIAEALWKTKKPTTATGSDPANLLRGYAYGYDRASRITGARYQTYEGGVWGNTTTDFSVSGITYDGNGNLRTMNRMGTTNGSDTSPVRGTLDQLTYSYSPASGNQLLAVDDSPQGNANSAKHDFKDNGHNYATSGTVEYRYDDSGNLISDLNKNISGINYSRMNQPVVVNITDKQGIPNRIEYTYTATGTKLRKQLFVNGSTTAATTTDYVGPFVYEGGAAPIFVQTAEGRALYVSGPTYAWKYEYHIKDHLGNLRYAFRADKDNGGAETQAHAGMEPANAAEEEKQFQHVAETRLADPDRARTGSFVARLNARQGRRQGPTITLKVAAGDSVHAEVYGRYDHGGALGGLLPKGAVVTGAAVAAGAGQAGSDRTAPKAGQRRFWPLLGASIGFVPQLFKARVAELPAAYLRYELFNKDSQLVATRLQPLVRTATDEWQRLTVGTKADSAGYVRLSLANESGVAAYFDDMAARGVAPSPYQENHYDPFGLNLVGIEAAQSPNNSRFQYNGKEKQEDAGLNWNDYGARMYDAQLGRWNATDPLAEKWYAVSPYSYALNNPMLFVDPDGRDNVIYLQIEQSAYEDFSRKELRDIVRQANANFKELHLETRVKIAKGDIDISKLDKTDAVAVIGRGKDVIETVAGMNKEFSDELKETGFGQKDSPQAERSENMGNIIAIDSRSTKELSAAWQEKKTDAAAFLINHGAGHNAGLNHGGDDVRTNVGMLRLPAISIMTGGNDISKSVLRSGWSYTPGLNGFISDPYNKHGVIHGSYLNRFGNNPAKANLPTTK